MRFLASLLLLVLLSACGPDGPRGPVQVVVIGEEGELEANGVRLSPAGQHLRAATAEGLVSLDATGEVIPALAERWIITDDGRSYIFRIRNAQWSDGAPITANQLRQSLRSGLSRLRGTSLGLDLAAVEDVRAMTGRVIEIRLASPMPDFLRLLAQPELGLRRGDVGAGPMLAEALEPGDGLQLTALPPQMRGLPADENWEERVRALVLRAMPAARAAQAFASGTVDLVLNGRIESLPLADTGPLSRGTIRLDGTLGLFGLVFRHDDGFLGDALRREALAMAIDRDGLIQPFNIGGWRSATWIVPLGTLGEAGPQAPRWDNLSLQQRRSLARQRVVAWEQANGEEARVRIALPEGPGSDMLFAQLEGDFNLIDVEAERVAPGAPADLELRDRLARYDSPRWYLNQFHCGLRLGLCSPEADALVAQAVEQADPLAKLQLLAEAHRELVRAEVFIPLGAPVRWSLVRGDVFGFEANQWGLHPLFPLVLPPS